LLKTVSALETLCGGCAGKMPYSNMKYSFITGLFFLLLVPSSQEFHAQACGRYYVRVSVQSMNGKRVRDPSVMLKSIMTDETKGEQFSRGKADPTSFSTRFSEGHSFKEFHKIVVTAAGYKTADNQIKVLSCQNRNISVKLAPTGSSSPALWQFENTVSIQAKGADGKQIDDASLTISSGKNKPVEKEIKFGFANFDLPNGKYVFRISAPGYLNKDVEADLTAIANFNLKIQLMPEENNPESVSNLTGTVFDAYGSVVVGAKVMARDTAGSYFETLTNDEGIYILTLPFNKYGPLNATEARYDIVIEKSGFLESVIRGFVFIPSNTGKMNLDIGLAVAFNRIFD
jgi:hypothetical protein